MIRLSKKCALALLFLISVTVCKAQITLEHSFSGNNLNNNLTTSSTQFFYINFVLAGPKLIKSSISIANVDTIVIYNTDYSIYKSIALPLSGSTPNIVNISDNLFNSDSKIEFAYQTFYNATDPYNRCAFTILQDDGTTIFQRDSCTNYTDGLINNAADGLDYGGVIHNTSAGWKMFLTIYNNPTGGNSPTYTMEVYALPGSQQIAAVAKPVKADPFNLSNPYPNPSSDMAAINFKLPTSVNQGEIVIYNEQGELVKTLRVDNTFGKVLLNNSGLSAGTYFYLIKAGNDASDTKKMVVVP